MKCRPVEEEKYIGMGFIDRYRKVELMH